MGIEGLMKFIENKNSTYFKRVNLSRYKGSYVCIDAGSFYSRMVIVNKEILKSKTFYQLVDEQFFITIEDVVKKFVPFVFSFLNRFLTCGIIPIIVFDGRSPTEKASTRNERNKKIDECREKLSELRKEYKDKELCSDEILDKIRNYICQIFTINGEHFELIRKILAIVKIPYIQSSEESERLCCSLVKNQLCKAAFSEDSDMIPHLCPRWIRNIESVTRQKDNIKYDVVTCDVVYINKILEILDLSKEQIVEFCIGCKCDYNERVRGFGPAKIYKLLKTNSTLSNSFSEEQISILNLDRCKKMFSYKESKNMLVLDESFMVNKYAEFEIATEIDQEKMIEQLKTNFQDIKEEAIRKFIENRMKALNYK